jgi:hypothetical protein
MVAGQCNTSINFSSSMIRTLSFYGKRSEFISQLKQEELLHNCMILKKIPIGKRPLMVVCLYKHENHCNQFFIFSMEEIFP